jgi:2-C-methyl-D-erythritol 4-phosphate cytidylyltransferase
VIAAAPQWEEPSILLAEELGCGKVSACVTGGETRAESVRKGVAEVPDDAAAVVVHDSARPLLVEEVLERLLNALGEGWDGAVPVLPIHDTVKRIDGEQVAETVDREGLAVSQTPQAFAADALRRALGGEGTDCAALVEAQGGRVKAVPGDRRLLKITDPEDLALVESWL